LGEILGKFSDCVIFLKSPSLLITPLLSVIDNEAGDYTTAHDTENQLIEELRKMGNDALHCWADKACDKSSTHFHEQNPKYHYDGKKKSGGIQLSEKSR
jgi:hypothetical protein